MKIRAHVMLAVATLCAVFAAAPATEAHSPHDLALLLEVSPDYATDQTVFAIFRLSEHELFARSTDAGRSWQLYGPEFVRYRVVTLRFSPGFATDGTAFVATAGRGLFRSTDRGTSWARVDSSGLPTNITALDISPSFSLDGALVVSSSSGLARSTDGGITWIDASSGLTETELTAVSYLPGLAGQSLLAGGQMLHRSDDGGQTWTALGGLGDTLTRIAPSPRFETTPVVEIGLLQNGVALSVDGGLRFAPHLDGLLDTAVNDLRFSLDGTLFAATRTGLYRADGPGLVWTASVDGLEGLSDLTQDHYQFVVPSPSYLQDATLFAGGFEGAFRSRDGGGRWETLDVYDQRVNRSVMFAPDWPDDRSLYFANHGGGLLVYQAAVQPEPVGGTSGPPTLQPPPPATPTQHGKGMVSPPAPPLPHLLPMHWSSRGLGLGTLHLRPLALSPAFGQDRTLFTGHIGLYRSEDAGHSWLKLPIPAGVSVVRCMSLSPTYPADGTLFFATSGEGLHRSTDRGASWQSADSGLPPDLWTRVLRLSPTYPQDGGVWAATETGLWVSHDRGESWAWVDMGLGPGAPILRSLEFSPAWQVDTTLFAGAVTHGLLVSTDGGLSWQARNRGLPADGAGVDVESVAVSPAFAVDRTLFTSLRVGGVRRSVDAGISWQPAAHGLPLTQPRDLVLSPDFVHDRTLVLDSFDWSWLSTNAGQSWQRLSALLRVDDGSDQVQFEGPWSKVTSPLAHGKTRHGSKQARSWTEYEFYGNSVSWHAGRGPNHGIADILIDGMQVGFVDLYAALPVITERVWTKRFLEAGWHVVRVQVTGLASGASTDTWVVTDGFSVTFDDWPQP